MVKRRKRNLDYLSPEREMPGQTASVLKIMSACCGCVNMKIIALVTGLVSQPAGEGARSTDSFLKELLDSG